MRRDQNIINIEKPISSITEYIDKINMLLTIKASKERIFVFRGEPQKHTTFCQPNIFRKNVLSTNKFYEKSLFNTMRQNKLSNSDSYLENAIDAQHGEFPMAYLLEGKPKYEAAEKQKWISFENLIQMMEKLAEYYESQGMKAEAIKEREKALKFIDLVENSAYDVYVGFFNKRIEQLR